MTSNDGASQLVSFLKKKPSFTIQIPDYGGYDHMGATLSEAILQQGLNYDAQVKPRVNQIRGIPSARTTRGFLEGGRIPEQVGYGFKGRAVESLARFFAHHGVDTEADLRAWLQDNQHVHLLLVQHRIGPKTVDYLKNLVGIPEVAVDSWIRKTAIEAGVPATASYAELKEIIERTAETLGVSANVLDYSIWAWSARRRPADLTGTHHRAATPTPLLPAKPRRRDSDMISKGNLNADAREAFCRELRKRGLRVENPGSRGDLLIEGLKDGPWHMTVRSVRGRNYAFVPKSKWINPARQLLGFAPFGPDGRLVRLFIIPADAWIHPGQQLQHVLKSRDYGKPGQVSPPEWGIDSRHDLLVPYLLDAVLPEGSDSFHFPDPLSI